MRYALAFLGGVFVTLAVVLALAECEYQRRVTARVRAW